MNEQEKKPLQFKASEEMDVETHGTFAPREQLPHVLIVYADDELVAIDAITFIEMAGTVASYIAGSRPPEGHIHELVVEIGRKHQGGFTIGFAARSLESVERLLKGVADEQ